MVVSMSMVPCMMTLLARGAPRPPGRIRGDDGEPSGELGTLAQHQAHCGHGPGHHDAARDVIPGVAAAHHLPHVLQEHTGHTRLPPGVPGAYHRAAAVD